MEALFYLANAGEVYAGEYFNKKREKYVGVILKEGDSDSLPVILFTTYAEFTEAGIALEEMRLIIKKSKEAYRKVSDVLLAPIMA